MFEFSVPTPNGSYEIKITPGSSAIIVGANGAGKSRLAIEIEASHGLNAHRISGHRVLVLDTSIPKLSEEIAFEQLRLGRSFLSSNPGFKFSNNAQISDLRRQGRWNKKSNAPLDDFGFLLQTLFAENANHAVNIKLKLQKGEFVELLKSKLDHLVDIWERLLPTRRLRPTADEIFVFIPENGVEYKASELSDGERAIFYLIGQTLVADPDTLLIFDEPELHVHRSIMSSLWDELEAARPDCGFLFITHDLEFAASRSAAKYVIRSYNGSQWEIEVVPEDTGFDEETTTLILGSRRPILFVEGKRDSLDYPLYRACYPEWTVVPKGSCTNVKHSVATLNNNAAFTRVSAQGIVDADGYETEEIEGLRQAGIHVLPVSEIENLILLPSVAREILKIDSYDEPEIQQRLDQLKSAVFQHVQSGNVLDEASLRYATRRIDRILKLLSFDDFANAQALATAFSEKTGSIDVLALAQSYKDRVNKAITEDDLPTVLALYDNKGFLLANAAGKLRNQKLLVFKEWLLRYIGRNPNSALTTALKNVLPTIAVTSQSVAPASSSTTTEGG